MILIATMNEKWKATNGDSKILVQVCAKHRTHDAHDVSENGAIIQESDVRKWE